MSDRIAVMNAGCVLQIGTPTEIYERPNCRFVADFIGESNFIEGTVRASNGQYATIETSDGLEMQGYTEQPVSVGSSVVLSLRPEKARLSTVNGNNSQKHEANTFPAKVERVSYIGSDTRIIVRLASGRTIDVWEQNTRSTLDRDAYWQPGEAAILSCSVENALILTS